MLIGFLNFIVDENMPLTVSAAVEGNGGRLTVKTGKIGNTPYTFLKMGLIPANDQLIKFFHRERIYDVKVGMPSTKFRDIVTDMARRSVDTVSVIITSTLCSLAKSFVQILTNVSLKVILATTQFNFFYVLNTWF